MVVLIQVGDNIAFTSVTRHNKIFVVQLCICSVYKTAGTSPFCFCCFWRENGFASWVKQYLFNCDEVDGNLCNFSTLSACNVSFYWWLRFYKSILFSNPPRENYGWQRKRRRASHSLTLLFLILQHPFFLPSFTSDKFFMPPKVHKSNCRCKLSMHLNAPFPERDKDIELLTETLKMNKSYLFFASFPLQSPVVLLSELKKYTFIQQIWVQSFVCMCAHSCPEFRAERMDWTLVVSVSYPNRRYFQESRYKEWQADSNTFEWIINSVSLDFDWTVFLVTKKWCLYETHKVLTVLFGTFWVATK